MAKKKQIFHVQIKFPHTGWRLASQHYSQRSALSEAKRWLPKHLGVAVRVVEVKRKAKGLVKISRSGKVIG